MWAVDGQHTTQTNPDVVRLLLRAGAQTERRDQHKETPLLQAAGTRNEEAAKILLEAGANINARDDHNQTALMSAFYSASFTQFLLTYHPEFDARDNKGETALMKAVQSPNEDEGSAAAMLIEAGAAPNVRDAQGKNLIERANNKLTLPALEALLASDKVSAQQTRVITRDSTVLRMLCIV